jgi:hypothetical protein
MRLDLRVQANHEMQETELPQIQVNYIDGQDAEDLLNLIADHI